MNISFINQSDTGYGADQTTRHYHKEAEKRNHKVFWNIIDKAIDFYVVGMTNRDEELFEVLKPNKYVYIEHSIECLLPRRNFIRDFLMKNSLQNFFFSPRQKENIEIGLPKKCKHLAQEKCDYLVVPIDYNLFKPIDRLNRREDIRLFVGLIHVNKGILQVIKEAEENPDIIFIFIGGKHESYNINDFQQYSNIMYLGQIQQKSLPFYYNLADKIYLLAQNGAVESAGRTIFEGVLCGSDPITNNDVGNASWEWFKDRDEIIKHMDESTENLFNIIEGK